MPRHAFLSALIIVTVVFIGGRTLYGEELEVGEWSGHYKMGATLVQDVDYIVKRDKKGNLSITMHNKVSEYPFSNIKLGKNKLSFTWTPGDEDKPVACELELDEERGTFTGSCPIPGKDEPIVMEMGPKKVGKESESEGK